MHADSLLITLVMMSEMMVMMTNIKAMMAEKDGHDDKYDGCDESGRDDGDEIHRGPCSVEEEHVLLHVVQYMSRHNHKDGHLIRFNM